MLRISPNPHFEPALGRSCLAQGFSILEMLTVICLIGIISSVAIGWYAGAHLDVIERATNQRNAQEIVTLGVCATMGGAHFVVPGNKEATVQNLVGGTVGLVGMWKGKIFRLTSLRPEALPGALTFVKFDEGLLLYEPAGGQF